jgi:hypothetical protein
LASRLFKPSFEQLFATAKKGTAKKDRWTALSLRWSLPRASLGKPPPSTV